MNRSTCARRFGDNGVFRLISAPLVLNTSSNCAVNFVSLSRITYFGASSRSSASIRKFLACWLTHAESGLTVQGEIQHRRVPRCRNTRKYRSTNPRSVHIRFDTKSHCQSVSA